MVTATCRADHAHVAAPHFRAALPLLEGVQSSEYVAQVGSALEIERLRSAPHRRLDPAAHVRHAATEYLQDLVDHRAVLLARLEAHARGTAAADVVVEACASGRLVGQVVAAAADRVEALDDLQRLAHRADLGVRPEVACTVVLQP